MGKSAGKKKKEGLFSRWKERSKRASMMHSGRYSDEEIKNAETKEETAKRMKKFQKDL